MPWATQMEFKVDQYDGSNGETLLDQIAGDPRMGNLAIFTNITDSGGELSFDWSCGGGPSNGYGEGHEVVQTGDWLRSDYGGITVLTDAYVTERLIFKE